MPDQLERSSVEKVLWVLVDDTLAISQQRALAVKAADGPLGCVRQSSAGRDGGASIPGDVQN